MSNHVTCPNGPVHHFAGNTSHGYGAYRCGVSFAKEDKETRNRITCKNCLRVKKSERNAYERERKLAEEYVAWQRDMKLPTSIRGKQMVAWVDARKEAYSNVCEHCYKHFGEILAALDRIGASAPAKGLHQGLPQAYNDLIVLAHRAAVKAKKMDIQV